MENKETINRIEETEISFSKIFERLKSTWKLLLKKWWILSIATIMGAGTGWLYCYITGTTYVANCTFTVQGQSASSSLLSSALSLASSLGISTKGGGPSSYDNNFFANLMQSRRIVKESLLQEETVKGKKDLFANFYIQLYGYNDDWEGDNRLDGFTFKHNKISTLTRLEDSVLNFIYDKVMDDNLVVKFDDSEPFNNANFTSTSYDFSSKIMKHILDNTSSYYLREMYVLNDNNMMIAQKRLDSIANAIRILDQRVAKLKDNSSSTIRQSGLVDLNTALRDQGLLSVQYSSAVNNFELAKVALMTQSPVLDIIDDPLFSTDTNTPPIILIICVGAILFFAMTAGALMLSHFIKESIEIENKTG
ncbi:MAG: hypothetical protein WCI97_00135 [Bacteroidota bacterium]